jgi:hypothetical protein
MSEFKLTNSSRFGSSPYAQPWDDLPLPGGGTIGTTIDVQILRRIFHKMGIPEAHTAGKNILCERYRALLAKIGGNTSDPVQGIERGTSCVGIEFQELARVLINRGL